MPYGPHFPLAEVIETEIYPHARTLRTSFSQKLWDTYSTIAGKPPILVRKPHVGIFDYLTFYIPAGFLFLMGWCFENARKNFLAKVLLIPTAIINIPLLIARITFAAVATILFSPITAIVHGISRFFTKQSHDEALALEGDTRDGKKSLRQYLLEKNMDIEELNITLKKKPASEDDDSSPRLSESHTNRYQLMFWRKATGPSSGLVCEGCLNGGCEDNHAPFSVEISKDKNGVVKQARNIHSLFRLNVGDAAANIEDADCPLGITEKRAILAI